MNFNHKLVQDFSIDDIVNASRNLSQLFKVTPLQKNELLSQRYDCNLYLKREDLQIVRSFKIRGAYHFMQTLTEEELQNGVVCASAGNHAQGVAFSCKAMEVKGTIFMPSTTPKQKVRQVRFYGESFVEVILTGDTFDDSYEKAMEFCRERHAAFIHPFDDLRTIAGQGTIGMEIINQMTLPLDYVFATVGGGGLVSGVGSYIKEVSPTTKIIGAEPKGAPAMKESLEQNKRVVLEEMVKFVDGAAVKQVGELTFEICRKVLDDLLLVPEGKACTSILELYNSSAIVLEPAGALPIAALDFYKEEIRGKNVVCVVSGGNNDIGRMQDIKERSLIYEQYKHYFIVNFPQRTGALRQFLEEVLGKNDDITRFEYIKKNNRESGPALVGIELSFREDYHGLIERLQRFDHSFVEINKDRKLFNLLI